MPTPSPSSLLDERALSERLRTLLAARLGLDPAALDPRERFSRFGLDSAGATGWIAELSAELGRALSPTLVWAYPTLEQLARHLAGVAAGDGPALDAARGPRPAPGAPHEPIDEPIAVVGLACRFPGAPDPRAFWRLLCEGVDATRTVPADRWDAEAWYDPDPQRPGTINTRRGAFLDRVDGFDPLFFGISPREAAEMDPQQRLLLELAWEALEDAGIPPRALAGSRTGVFAGVIAHDYADLRKACGAAVTSHTGPGTSLSIVANRVSYLLGLRGPSLAVDTACSASLVAVHLACRSLCDGESTLALAGGVNLILSPAFTVELTKFGGLSGDGRCKAFDARADGFARGEGGGLVVLKALSRALADGDRIYGLIRGSAVNNDGASNGLTAPSPGAQIEVLQEAYARSGVDPARVDYVEAHGTGTRLGDPIEARALAAVLCAGRESGRPLQVGSVKTNIGHQEGAAGIAGLLKLVLAIHHRTLPPSLHFETPNPDIPFEELRLRVQTELGPWPRRESGEPAVGGVSSFGWGGTNCHMVLEEWPRGIEIPRSDTPSLRDGPGADRPLVFVFSGVGSQWPGMARDLLHEPLFRARLEQCDRVLQPLAGWSVLAEVAAGGGEHWQRAEVALPLLAIVQMALADLWRSLGIEPAAGVGHSVGEIPAAYTAGVLSLEQAARVAFWYSRSLHRIDGRGALGVVALPPPEAAGRLGGGLELAGWLSPASSVVAGAPGEVEALVAAVTAEGRFAARVHLQAAAHSSQLEPHLPEMRDGLADLAPRPPRIPLASTLTGAFLDRPMDAAYWAENLRRPVLFAQAVASLLASGHELFLEVDPHPILATPLAQCFAAAGAAATALPSLRRGEPAAEVLSGSLAGLKAAGVVRAEQIPADRAELVPLSARTPEALRDLARLVAGQALEPAEGSLTGSLADLAWTAAVRRGHHEHRLAAVVRSRAELAAGLEAFARGEAVPGFAAGRSRRGDPAGRGGLVFAFSGQGPQWPGMGRQLLAGEPVFRAAFERCDEALRPWLGESLPARLDRDEKALDSTELAQPALFALQVALAALWRSWGVTPDAVVGHSVGEIAAAHVAGALTLEQAARVAAVRGRAMEAARGRGGMVAVELSEEEVRAALSEMSGEVGEGEGADRPWIAAVNSPSAVVVAGAPAVLDAAVAALQARGAVCRRLRVEYPFHGPLMEPTDRAVEAGLADLRPAPAVLPVISTVTGGAIAGEELDGAYWRRNVREPVRFAQAVAVLADHEAFLEIGPHPVLAANISQGLEAHAAIARSGRTPAVLASLRRGRDERSTLLEALGALYTLGRPVDWHGVHPDGGRLVALPTYPFQRQRYWFETPVRPRQEAAAAPSPDLPAPPAPAAPAARLEPGAPEQLFAAQLDAFHRMVGLQLAVLRQAGAGDSLQDDF